MTHTPGPWFRRSPSRSKVWWIVREDGKRLAQVLCSHDVNDDANAHLIASAPDLLEALKAFLTVNSDEIADMPMSHDLARALGTARAAIALAHGEEVPTA